MIQRLIRRNRQKSFALFLLMGALSCALGYAVGAAYAARGGGAVGAALAVSLWIGQSAAAYYAGDSIFLTLSGAVNVSSDEFTKLRNILEEIKIAAGLPAMPALYVIRDDSLNAFSVGRTPQKSAIAVTEGLLVNLTRDELQGVMAHEAAHIANRDSLYMIFAGAMLGSVMVVSDFLMSGLFRTRASGYYRASGKSAVRGNPLFMVVALALALFAPFLAKALYYSISRKREYLADAMAVHYTRYPDGLAGALEKVLQSGTPTTGVNSFMAPIYFSETRPAATQSVFDPGSTHPPLYERIRILRQIAGGASAGFASYTKSYRENFSGRQLLAGQSTAEPAVPGPSAAAAAVPAPGGRNPAPESGAAVFTRRSLHDAVLREHNFTFIQCECGLKLKLPNGFGMNKPRIKCPRCGVVHDVSRYY